MIIIENEYLDLIVGGKPCNCLCSGGKWEKPEYRGVYDSLYYCSLSCQSAGFATGSCI
ncbi:hypothetical protein NF27_CF00020 [Candidatus Jidaibacter acanthamoeba]|uniref:Uncharacterized protein n=1 Tax=Candidatus Jidaibacter acanthamoebae TaxID=86105 RepID=A0A0C1QQ59_9RICK|nr:hypothetical protein NF27_CF00020 [Candidatus Jidaibacter acanthamoeba]